MNQTKITEQLMEVLEEKETFDQMILAEGVTSTFDSQQTGLNNNIIVLGATGSGKSMSMSEPQILHSDNNSLVVTMTKRKIADKNANLLRSKGYQVEIIDMTKPHLSTVRFDPLDYVIDDTDIVAIAEQIVLINKNRGVGRDPYWDDAAISLICAEIAALTESWDYARENGECDSPEPTLGNLLELHRQLRFTETDRTGFTTSTLDKLFERLEKRNPDSYAARCFKSVKGLTSKTVSCILSTVDTAYSRVFTPNVCTIADRACTFDPFMLGKKKSALFIISSPVEKSSKYFANMIYSTLIRFLFDLAENSKDYRLPVPVHMICDDFACGATIPNFADYISIIRSAGISVALLIQSEAQLETLYGPADAMTILNNCDRTVYFGGTDLTTCERIAKRANVPLEKVLNMPLGKSFVFQRGSEPVYTDRYHTKEDPVWIMVNEAINGPVME